MYTNISHELFPFLVESEREETHHVLVENSESIEVNRVQHIANKSHLWTTMKAFILQKLVEAFEELRVQAEADQRETLRGFSFNFALLDYKYQSSFLLLDGWMDG